MAKQKSISFRSSLVSSTTDLLAGVDVHCARTAKLIAALVSRLAAYTEEGVPLSPSVFVCNSIKDLLLRAGSGEHVALSSDVDTESAAPKILKDAAPLSAGGWCIYIERQGDGAKCSYGVFFTANDPAALTAKEVLLHDYEPGFPIVCIGQRGTNKVAVVTNGGDGIEFRFNDDVDVVDLADGLVIAKLARRIARHVPSRRDEFSAFIDRMLADAIASSHGCLVAVLLEGESSAPEALTDAVVLQPKIDLFDRYLGHVEGAKTADTMGRLQMASELLKGFLHSDGITIFTSSGSIVGYRAFIKSEEPKTASTGGARTRAFEALKSKLGTQLSAVFFRSQDGRTELGEHDA